jgi:hypothetical protein
MLKYDKATAYGWQVNVIPSSFDHGKIRDDNGKLACISFRPGLSQI